MIAPLVLGLWLLLSSPVWAAIACGTSTTTGSTATSPLTHTMTPDAGSNRILIVDAHVQDDDADNIDITGASSSAGGTFTSYGTATVLANSADIRVRRYYSTDFADGSQTITVTLSSTPIRGRLVTYVCTGVNTASPWRDVAATNTGNGTTASVDVTGTAATDLVTDGMIAAALNAGVNPTIGAGQTQLYLSTIGTDNVDVAGSSEPGNGGTVTMSWTSLTGVEGWATVAGALVDASASSGGNGALRRRAQ